MHRTAVLLLCLHVSSLIRSDAHSLAAVDTPVVISEAPGFKRAMTDGEMEHIYKCVCAVGATEIVQKL